MPRGGEDWGIDVDAATVVATPTSEIDVRLGSSRRISRTGHTFYDTNFATDLLLWRITKHQSNGALGVFRRKGVFQLGCFQVYLGAAVNGSWTLEKRFPLIDSPKWGLETIVWFNTGNVQFQASLTINDGVNDTIYGYELNSADDQLKILDSDGVYDDVQAITITPAATEDFWIYNKMIVNHDTQAYQSVVLNQTSITTIAQTPDINLVADLPHALLKMFIDNTANAITKFMVGYVALTIDEP